MSYWCCARIDGRHERLAIHCLGLAKHTIYQPRIRAPRKTTAPLFPSYLFVLIELQWHTARWSPGINKIIMTGDSPTRVPDRIIEELRSRERGGLVVLPAPRRLDGGGAQFEAGDKVRVRSGPLSGLVGLVEGLRPHARVELLLQMLGSLQRVELPAATVALVG
jgi:transcriptional antiterminator RfaH